MFIKRIIPVLALDRVSVTFKDYIASGSMLAHDKEKAH